MWSKEGSISRWMSPASSQASLSYYNRHPYSWDSHVPTGISRNNSASTISSDGAYDYAGHSMEGVMPVSSANGARGGQTSKKNRLLSPARSILKRVRKLSGGSDGGSNTGKSSGRHSSGQVNMKAVSLMIAAMCVVMLGSMAIASASKDTIEEATVEAVLSALYSISAVWIAITLILGWTKRLTVDEKYLHPKNNRLYFQKIGAAIFGTGAMLYNSLRIAQFVAEVEECRRPENVVAPIMSILFTSLQVYLILIYAKVTINKGKLVPVLSKFGFMLVLSTNISVWIITTISEAKHTMEVELKKDHVVPVDHVTYTTSAPHSEAHADNGTVADTHSASSSHTNHSSHDASCGHGSASYQTVFASYLYPFVIEYSLISATTVYLIWSKVKIKNKRKFVLNQRQDVPRSISFYGNHRGNHKRAPKMDYPKKCFSIVLPQIKEESLSDDSTGNCESPKLPKAELETGTGGGGGGGSPLPRPKSLPVIKNTNEKAEDDATPLSCTNNEVTFNIGSSEFGPDFGHCAEPAVSNTHAPSNTFDDHVNMSNGGPYFAPSGRNKHVSSIRSVASEKSIATTVFEPNWAEEKEHTYVNNHCGLFLGMQVILVSVAIIIVFLYLMYNGHSPDLANHHLFGTKITINVMCIVVTMATHVQMKGLMKKTDNLREVARFGRRHAPSKNQQHQLSMDKSLLGIAILGLLAYCMLTIIAGLSTESADAALTTADAFCTSIEAIIQSLFLVTSFLPRRATLVEHREKRPGRQGLFFLLCCNFCLWALNSFGLRNEIANHVQIGFYSFKTWVILSHVTLPLLILFRFHSIVCIADVITHAYTAKYIGLEI